MASINLVQIIGRIGKDPEVRYTQTGQMVASMTVATDESYTSKDGQKVEKTEWHRVVVWGKQAEFCGNYLAKGRMVYIEGKLQTRKWQDQSGAERYTTEIMASRVLGLDRPHAADGGAQQRPASAAQTDMDHQYGPQFPSDASGLDEPPF